MQFLSISSPDFFISSPSFADDESGLFRIRIRAFLVYGFSSIPSIDSPEDNPDAFWIVYGPSLGFEAYAVCIAMILKYA